MEDHLTVVGSAQPVKFYIETPVPSGANINIRPKSDVDSGSEFSLSPVNHAAFFIGSMPEIPSEQQFVNAASSSPSSPQRNKAASPLPTNVYSGSPPDVTAVRKRTVTGGASPPQLPSPGSGPSLIMSPPSGLSLIPHLQQVSHLCNDVVNNMDITRQYPGVHADVTSRDTAASANSAMKPGSFNAQCIVCWQLHSQLQQSEATVKQLTLDLHKVIDKNQEWQSYKGKVDAKLAESKVKLQDAQQQKQAALDQVARLQDQLAQAEKEKGTALTTQQLADMDSLHLQMKAKVATAEEENTQLKANTAQLTTLKHDQEDTIRRLQQQLRERSQSNGKQAAEDEERIGVLQQQIQVLAEDFRQEQRDKENEHARAETLQRQLSNLRRQLSSLNHAPPISRSQSSPHHYAQPHHYPSYRQAGLVGGGVGALLEMDGPEEYHANKGYNHRQGLVTTETSPFSMPTKALTARGGGYDVTDSADFTGGTQSLHLVPRGGTPDDGLDMLDGPILKSDERNDVDDIVINRQTSNGSDDVDGAFIEKETPSPYVDVLLYQESETPQQSQQQQSVELLVERLDQEEMLQCPKCAMEFPVMCHLKLIEHTEQCLK